MNKRLLLAFALFLNIAALAQFTQSNEPMLGNGETLYIIDSNAVNYENITGTGVIWDYSMYGGYGNVSRSVSVLDPSSTANAADFTSSTQAVDIENATTYFFNSTASERIGQGYVFNEQTLGEVKLVFDTDEATLMTYPMNVGDVNVDTYQGTLYFSLSGVPQSPSATGSIITAVDGQGTLKLADGNDYSNVLRYKLVDTANSTLPFVGGIQLVRHQYEYYDHTTSNLPLFNHTSLSIIQSDGSVLADISLILSKHDPSGIVSLTEEATALFSVYPNPTTDNITIKADGTFVYSVFNSEGKTIYKGEANTENSVNVASLETGVYFVKVEKEGKIEIKKIMIL